MLQALCTAVVCRSVPVVGALATYELPVRTQAAPTVPEWLVSCIGDAVKHLDQAPFLQLLLPGRPKRLERHRVTHAVVQAPQVSLTLCSALRGKAKRVREILLGDAGDVLGRYVACSERSARGWFEC